MHACRLGPNKQQEKSRSIYLGIQSECTARQGFHHFTLDTDDVCALSKLFNGLFELTQEFPKLANCYIVQSNPFNWHVISFSWHSLEELFTIWDRAVELGIVTPEYVHWSKLKEYSVLRTGQKINDANYRNALNPRMRYVQNGNGEECNKCKQLYFMLLKLHKNKEAWW